MKPGACEKGACPLEEEYQGGETVSLDWAPACPPKR